MSSLPKKIIVNNDEFTLTWSWRDPHLYVNGTNSRRGWAPWSSPLPDVVDQKGNVCIAEAIYIVTQAKLNIDYYENYMNPAPKLSRQQLLDFMDLSSEIDKEDTYGKNTQNLIDYVGLHGLMTESRYIDVDNPFSEDVSFPRYKFLFTEMKRDDKFFVDHSRAEIEDSPLLARVQLDEKNDEIRYDTPIKDEYSGQDIVYGDGHAIALTGTAFMTDKPERRYFELQNSWGKGWADKGFSVIEHGRLNNIWVCKQIP